MVSRIAAFFDFENTRRLGELAFDPNGRGMDSPSPVRLADAIAMRRSEPSVVERVTVVRGKPNPAYQPAEARRYSRDRRLWLADPRTLLHELDLHYDRAHRPCKEAGVDLRLGLELYKAAESHRYDALVVCSGDLDLKPAIEDAIRLGAHVELAQWDGYGNSTVLSDWFTRRYKNWIHRLTADDYWDALNAPRDAA